MREKWGAVRRIQGWFCAKVALGLGKRQDIARCGLLTSLIQMLYAKVIRAQYFTLAGVWFGQKVGMVLIQNVVSFG